MRWRFIDRVYSFEPWRLINGRKAVSIEEANLLNLQNGVGCFPHLLTLEYCLELIHWLVTISSKFTQTIELKKILDFQFNGEVKSGEALDLVIELKELETEMFLAVCRVKRGGTMIGAGKVTASLASFEARYDSEFEKGLWEEIYVAT